MNDTPGDSRRLLDRLANDFKRVFAEAGASDTDVSWRFDTRARATHTAQQPESRPSTDGRASR